jgi:predicted nucleic acid-binding Zn ribbon protein
MGGHTLGRHVGKTDAQLAERLRLERQISAASTYTDRATAERSVGTALAEGGTKLSQWQRRVGRRPNLVLYYAEPSRKPIGRSLMRGRTTSVPCTRAIIVLRWDERQNKYYVLTSYPETDR